MLAYSIEHARLSGMIDRIVVSTDDSEIAAVAAQYGAEVIWRPADISGDTCTSESALRHALTCLRTQDGYEPDLVVFLQATSPLRRPNDVRGAIEMLLREEADSLFSACRAHGFVWREQNGEISSFSYDYRERPRRQDAPRDLVENGSIYVFRPALLEAFNNRLGGRIAVYEMDALSSFQVDEPEDLKLMELLIHLQPLWPHSTDLGDIRLLVLDFDGVMTDNLVMVSENGEESVWCHRGDGWGLTRVKELGVEVIVLSTETNGVVGARCRKLEINCVQACADKVATLRELVRERSINLQQVAYVGNDVNDLECMLCVGLPIAVADAVPEILAVARIVTTQTGGKGAVREVCNLIRSKIGVLRKQESS